VTQRPSNSEANGSAPGAPGQALSMGCLKGCVALVTGASSGVGRAIALALSRLGADLYVVARNTDKLRQIVEAAGEFSKATGFCLDLTAEGSLGSLSRKLEAKAGRLDILVHSAGVLHQDLMERARVEDLDLQYAVNVRVPYGLTKLMLPMLISARGQVVFINSSLGLSVKRPEVGQYASTKHALKAIADSLREEVNPRGVRVLTLYLGRTATPMQEVLCSREGRLYQPERLLQPEDVAAVIVHALMLPSTAEVTDISIRPMIKS
jgi:NAD(P)-dependent dehydrogenase (short-subunit alcohol dehydrogenase family)